MSATLRSGQLAGAAGVNLPTLRYYERRGLLPQPRRSLGGHREYGPEAVIVLRIIKAVQRLGFTLGEIAELLAVGSHRGPRPGLRERAQDKIAEVDARIAQLQEVRETLTQVVAAGCTDLAECSCLPECPIPFTGVLGAAGSARSGEG